MLLALSIAFMQNQIGVIAIIGCFFHVTSRYDRILMTSEFA